MVLPLRPFDHVDPLFNLKTLKAVKFRFVTLKLGKKFVLEKRVLARTLYRQLDGESGRMHSNLLILALKHAYPSGLVSNSEVIARVIKVDGCYQIV